MGQFGSIPFIERLILTNKRECTTRVLVPFSLARLRKELSLFATWYNRFRPHERLAGATPDEVHGGSTAHPPAPLGARDRPLLRVRYLGGERHLPVVELARAA